MIKPLAAEEWDVKTEPAALRDFMLNEQWGEINKKKKSYYIYIKHPSINHSDFLFSLYFLSSSWTELQK